MILQLKITVDAYSDFYLLIYFYILYIFFPLFKNRFGGFPLIFVSMYILFFIYFWGTPPRCSGWVKLKKTALFPTVPPSPPLCRIPTSVTTGKNVILSCHDKDGSPPPQYKWYRDNVLLPPEPSKIAGFQNSTYVLNSANGNLVSYSALRSWPTLLPAPHFQIELFYNQAICLLRSFPMSKRQIQLSTPVRRSTLLVLHSAVELWNWKSVSEI